MSVSIEAPIAASRSSSQSPECLALPPLRMTSPVTRPRPTLSAGTHCGTERTSICPVTTGRSWFSSRKTTMPFGSTMRSGFTGSMRPSGGVTSREGSNLGSSACAKALPASVSAPSAASVAMSRAFMSAPSLHGGIVAPAGVDDHPDRAVAPHHRGLHRVHDVRHLEPLRPLLLAEELVPVAVEVLRLRQLAGEARVLLRRGDLGGLDADLVARQLVGGERLRLLDLVQLVVD